MLAHVQGTDIEDCGTQQDAVAGLRIVTDGAVSWQDFAFSSACYIRLLMESDGLPISHDPNDLFGPEDGDARSDYLSGLNSAQREAVETVDGPLLILAGAGTGKTKALTTRVAHILRTQKAWPSQILTVTFTNKAAGEMAQRVGTIVGDGSETMPWLGTFHSMSAKILRRHAERVGLKSNFNIIDTDDTCRLIKQLMVADNIDPACFQPRTIAGVIGRWKDKGWVPDDVPPEEKSRHRGIAHSIFTQYQDRLKTLNAADFGDLIVHVLQILKSSPDILELYQRRFRYILVDEYQDTNVAQYLWLRLLTRGVNNICCVGDDDQSIYAWRGAEVRNILDFQTCFPEAKVIRLEQNYRSTQHILSTASGLIAKNAGRLGKTLWTESVDGDKVTVLQHGDGQAEAAWICSEIEALIRGRNDRSAISLNDVAILVRAASLMRVIEERLMDVQMNYRVVGGPRFYERREIRDAIAYLRVIHCETDDLAFERVINLPRRGVGAKTLLAIRSRAVDNGMSMLEAVRDMLAEGKFSGRAATGLSDFVKALAVWRDSVKRHALDECVKQVLEESGLARMWQDSDDDLAVDRLENLSEFVNAVSKFDELAAFLQHVALVLDVFEERSEPAVSLMTIHAAKGTEFKVVFLPAWEEGCFPSRLAIEEDHQRGLEEERRLAYVAITRAKETCIVSCARSRGLHGKFELAEPSRFLQDLPREHCDFRRGSRMPGVPRPRNIAPPASILPSPTVSEAPRLRVGDRVFNQKFGNGQVMTVEGHNAVVAFDAAGTKTVLARYLSRVR